jgi:hypothetical protein
LKDYMSIRHRHTLRIKGGLELWLRC